MVKRFGSVQLTPKLYVCDRAGVLGEDITSVVRSGKVSYAEDRTSPMAFQAVVRDPDAVTPFTDFLAPSLTLTYPDGTETTDQLGVYAVAPPVRDADPRQTIGTLDGRDLTWVVAAASLDTAYTVPAGADRAAVVRVMLTGLGLKHSIPTGGTFARKTTWRAGTSKLTVLNDTLRGMGYYDLYMTRTGVLTSKPYVSLWDAEIAATYSVPATGTVRVLADPIKLEPLSDRLANRIVVRAEQGSGAVITSIATNANASSPISTVNVGYVITREATPEQTRTIDTQAAADALANRLLERAASYYTRLTLTTSRDIRNPHEVYSLDIANAAGDEVASGRWHAAAWEIGFTPHDGPMRHTLNKVYKWSGT